MDQREPKIEWAKIYDYINNQFDKTLPTFFKFLEVPSQSSSYDPEWETNGYLLQSALILKDWILEQQIQGLKLELLNDQGFSPFLFGEVTGSSSDDQTILFYGHMDKQPPFEGWRDGLHPYKPVIVDGKLYGRGAGDDGYSIFASTLAIKACQEYNIKHPRIIFLFETDEESDNLHIYHYLDLLKPRIEQGNVALVICLDANCANYDQFWLTTTLRGVVTCQFTVSVLSEGVHSGDASGIVPSSFRVARLLLDRIECSKTGEVHPDFQVNIPGERYLEAQDAAEIIGQQLIADFPWVNKNMKPVDSDKFQSYINNIWKAQLSVVGAQGIPLASRAGNVLRPYTTFKISLRLPPISCSKRAIDTMKQLLTNDVPYGASVTIDQLECSEGWMCPPNKLFINQILNEASQEYFKKPMLTMGEGGTIPLMNILQGLYPNSQFIVTGVLGPLSNAHGPNEFLHIDYCKRLIASLTYFVGKSYIPLQTN